MNKSRVWSLILLFVFAFIFWKEFHKQDGPIEVSIEGATMGTSYHIKYLDKEGRNFQSQIDSVLKVFNQSLNHYLPDSEISKFNKHDSLSFSLPYFYPVLQRSKEIFDETDGAFDPTVAPLVNSWGFGPEGGELPDSVTVDSLLALVGLNNIRFNNIFVQKLKPHMQLNFSAIAKGYGVDVVADFLKSQQIDNMMVEIGGELICKGLNKTQQPWRIGIDNPLSEGEITATVGLQDKALATSGNYRNYYEKDGKRYSHTINPKTGYPVAHTLLSASVFADDCMTADGFATAFMVLGLEKSIEILNKDKSLEAYLIYDDEHGNLKTYTTEGIADKIKEL